MAYTKLISGMAIAALMGSVAIAQTNVVVEPVPQQMTLDQLPIEYDNRGVIKAQHIKPGDISDAEYQALLEEADRIRAFQSTQGDYTGISFDAATSQSTTVAETTTYTSVPSTNYEIQMFDTPAESVIYAETTPTTSYTSVPVATAHTIVKGDTLYNISKRFGVTVDGIRNANGMTSNNLALGQVLTIPASNTTVVTESAFIAPVMTVGTETTTVFEEPKAATLVRNVQPIPTSGIYAVLPGDTMYSIARRACVTVGGIVSTNGIADATAIKPGQRLTMPQGHCLN